MSDTEKISMLFCLFFIMGYAICLIGAFYYGYILGKRYERKKIKQEQIDRKTRERTRDMFGY